MKDLIFFRKDRWIGEGSIDIEEESESFPMVMKVTMKDTEEKSDVIEFSVAIQLDQADDVIENYYTITLHRGKKFHVLIAGETWGHVEGSGFYKDDFIGWDVTSPDGLFHGYESIEMKKGGELVFFGEYAAKDEMRSVIKGNLTSYENIPS
ncbi:MAG: hypothetical protein S4CHLAM20_14450 [Chlamydiia bacterium]|nr:hypothetical protein [Chlamydiia bacterium]